MLPILAFTTLLTARSAAQISPTPIPLELSKPLQDKNFYFLSLIERDAKLRNIIEQDLALKAIANTKRACLAGLFGKLDFSHVEALGDLKFTPTEVAIVESRLSGLLRAQTTHDSVKSFVSRLRASGASQQFTELSDEKFLISAWRSACEGVNRVIDVYGIQKVAARSAAIDSPLYTVKNTLYGGMLKTLAGVVAESTPDDVAFFVPSLKAATELLQVQLRDEAARHEPMESGLNAPAYKRAHRVDFAKYPYSCILVPGFGPEEANVRMSPIGHLELELAVRRYRAGKAPFIIVSGGYVHPNMTPYSEAIEMRRCLIDEFGVPSEAIILDPHARHTTTNLRNAARLIYRYGMPFQKKALIVTNSYQLADIAAPSFAKRCMSVFGYLPATDYNKVSNFDLEYKPALNSLTIDPIDPLDP